MNVIEISCPAKTFIIGEYAVLDAGSAIILNTAPRFVCHIKKNSKALPLNFHPKSPAGQWIKKNNHDFQSVQMEWKNFYPNRGGLGFSSAQFNILYAYSCILREGSIDQIKPQELWRSYRNLQFDGFLPSGADVIAQWVGGVSVFEQEPLSVETFTYSLPDLHCFVLSTGESFQTYNYLKNFQFNPVSELKEIAYQGTQSFKQKDELSFLDSINAYRQVLQKKKYVTKKSEEIMNQFKSSQAIKAYKACGAMGAETVIVFYNKEDEEQVRKEVSFLEILADSSQITYGLSFRRITKTEESEP